MRVASGLSHPSTTGRSRGCTNRRESPASIRNKMFLMVMLVAAVLEEKNVGRKALESQRFRINKKGTNSIYSFPIFRHISRGFMGRHARRDRGSE